MSTTIIASVTILKGFGIMDRKSYFQWIVINHPDKVMDDDLKTQRTEQTAIINGHMAIARDFFGDGPTQQAEAQADTQADTRAKAYTETREERIRIAQERVRQHDEKEAQRQAQFDAYNEVIREKAVAQQKKAAVKREKDRIDAEIILAERIRARAEQQAKADELEKTRKAMQTVIEADMRAKAIKAWIIAQSQPMPPPPPTFGERYIGRAASRAVTRAQQKATYKVMKQAQDDARTDAYYAAVANGT